MIKLLHQVRRTNSVMRGKHTLVSLSITNLHNLIIRYIDEEEKIEQSRDNNLTNCSMIDEQTDRHNKLA